MNLRDLYDEAHNREPYRKDNSAVQAYEQEVQRLNTRLGLYAGLLQERLEERYATLLNDALRVEQWPGISWRVLTAPSDEHSFSRWLHEFPDILALDVQGIDSWIPACPPLDFSRHGPVWQAVLEVLSRQSCTYAMRVLITEIQKPCQHDPAWYADGVFFVAQALERQGLPPGAVMLWFFRHQDYKEFAHLYHIDEPYIAKEWAEIADLLPQELCCLLEPWP